MEENREASALKYGSKEWLRSNIPDKEKKESEGKLSSAEQQRACYQDVKFSCFVAHLYRRNLLDKNTESLTEKIWNLIGPRIEQYHRNIKEAASAKKINIKKLPNIPVFPPHDLAAEEQHLLGFFEKPILSSDENPQIEIMREELKLKEQIWRLCFNFDKITGKLLSDTNITYENIMNALYDGNEGDLATVVNNTAQALSGAQFFNIPGNDVVELREKLFDGRVYAPPQGEHNWSNNLSWLLAHIHKGDNVIIFSEITLDVFRRTTKNYEKELSGFAREVALLHKLGYNFTKIDDQYQATPPLGKDSYLSNLSITEALMPDEEVEFYYKDLMNSFAEKKATEIKKSEQTPEFNKKRKSPPTKSTMFSNSPVEQAKLEIPTMVNEVVENVIEQEQQNKFKKAKTDRKDIK